MTVDLSKLVFYGGANYMKRDSLLTGSELVAGITYDSLITPVKTINHAYGYVPFVHVACDLNNDGKIYTRRPMTNGYSGLILSYGDTRTLAGPEFYWRVDDQNLYLYYYKSDSGSESGKLYWTIYRDYGDVS